MQWELTNAIKIDEFLWKSAVPANEVYSECDGGMRCILEKRTVNTVGVRCECV